MTLPTNDERSALFNEVHARIGGFSAFNEAFEEMIRTEVGFKIGKEFLRRSIHWHSDITASLIWCRYMGEKSSPDTPSDYTFKKFINEFRG